jgi:4-hydroxybutyryl-CoA dehydratase/vinylacetyl-CoA-Delta-isomerase
MPAIPLLSIWMLDTGRVITSASHHFLERAQFTNVVMGAMTVPKGDRSKAPSHQADPDVFLAWVRRDQRGVYVSGARMHQTGLSVHTGMPTMRMTEGDRNWSVVGAIRSDAPGLTYVVGRQTNARAVDGSR